MEEIHHIDGNPRNNEISNLRRVETPDVLYGPETGEFTFCTAAAWRYARQYMAETDDYRSVHLPWHIKVPYDRVPAIAIGVQMYGLKMGDAE